MARKPRSHYPGAVKQTEIQKEMERLKSQFDDFAMCKPFPLDMLHSVLWPSMDVLPEIERESRGQPIVLDDLIIRAAKQLERSKVRCNEVRKGSL